MYVPFDPWPNITTIQFFFFFFKYSKLPITYVSFLASVQFGYLQEMPCTTVKVRGKWPFGRLCYFAAAKQQLLQYQDGVLSVCQHPESHRQGSVGETGCSCCLSLSADKYSCSLQHFWFLNVHMHDYSPNPLPLEHRGGRRERKLWLAPTGTSTSVHVGIT